jgi:hypothetical protein
VSQRFNGGRCTARVSFPSLATVDCRPNVADGIPSRHEADMAGCAAAGREVDARGLLLVRIADSVSPVHL